jgi:hypothetical protein
MQGAGHQLRLSEGFRVGGSGVVAEGVGGCLVQAGGQVGLEPREGCLVQAGGGVTLVGSGTGRGLQEGRGWGKCGSQRLGRYAGRHCTVPSWPSCHLPALRQWCCQDGYEHNGAKSHENRCTTSSTTLLTLAT